MRNSTHTPDPPDLARAKQLLDDLKRLGFRFERTAPGQDGPLVGRRVSGPWVDTIHIEGFSRDCAAWRERRSTLIVPGGAARDRRVSGGALMVLGEVLTWEANP